MPIQPSRRMNAVTRCIAMLWITGLLIGVFGIASYATRPGETRPGKRCWPSTTTLEKPKDRTCVVMFLHPKCPCSRATLREFQRISGLATIDVRIGFYCPPDQPDSWIETDLFLLAERVAPGGSFVDRAAQEARRFGASTSGHLFAFSSVGRCLFSGGVTTARGHEGKSLGRSTLEDITAGFSGQFVETPVFGCPLVTSQS